MVLSLSLLFAYLQKRTVTRMCLVNCWITNLTNWEVSRLALPLNCYVRLAKPGTADSFGRREMGRWAPPWTYLALRVWKTFPNWLHHSMPLVTGSLPLSPSLLHTNQCAGQWQIWHPWILSINSVGKEQETKADSVIFYGWTFHWNSINDRLRQEKASFVCYADD